MKKEIADKWIAWLRDPWHKQIKGALKTKKGHCCLGGLCELFVEANGETWIWDDGTHGFILFGFGSSLPIEVMGWAEISSTIGRYGIDGNSLIRANDDEGRSFLEIADIIEKHWESM